ncbi:MAG: response regulator transcription factor [Chitinophagaceae bacterium]|jgi:DNA-binding NarL/FixJ family response regulator|nr:response regulator transcription factor [Chitinophagaceae bacterium]MCU0403536.1 response regulator transcription factor [Chitinophagaceae bacterium]
MTIPVAIVEDIVSNRNIIRQKLLRSGFFDVVLIAENGEDFLVKMKALKEEQLPSIVLMDLEMPVLDGVDAVTIGSYLFPSIKFVVLTIFDDDERIFKAIKGGACGYLLKDESSDNIAEMLVQMNETGVGPISPAIAHKILQLVQQNGRLADTKTMPEKRGMPFNLTERELEILKLLVQGLLYKQIAAALDISVNTAKKHVLNIYAKLHVNTKGQALALVFEKGII